MKSVIRLLLVLCSLPLAAPAVTAPDQLQFADGLFARGLYDLAAREYLSVASQAGAPVDQALFRAAEAYRLLGDRAQASPLYRRVADEFPQREYAGRANFRYAEIAVVGGEYVDAVNRFRALVSREPPAEVLAPALYYLGYAQRKMKMPDEAEQAYRRLVKDFPDSPYAAPARVDLADVLIRKGGSAPEIRKLLEVAAERAAGERTGAEALYLLGDFTFRAAEYGASADAFGRLLRDYPQDPRSREARRSAAWAYFRAEKPAEALAIAGAPPEADDPHAVEWLYLRANSLRQLGRTEEAAAAYAQLLDRHPDAALAQAARYETAVMAFQAKDYARAYELSMQVAPAPDFAPDLAWLRAESARAAGRRNEAIQHYEELVRDFGSSDRAPAARFQVARLLQEEGRHADASRRYRELVEAHPDHELAAEALFASAYCRVLAKDYEEAVRDWDVLLKRYPSFAARDEALYGKAQAEVELNRAAAARATLETLLKGFPKSKLAAEAHYLLGSLMESEDHFEAAEYHYRMATLKKPDPSLVRKIEFRRVAVLQRQGRHDEAAQTLNGLVEAGGDEVKVPPALLDWLVRWNFAKELYPETERAARQLAVSAPQPAWQQIGWYFAGRSLQAQNRGDEARAAYDQALAKDAATREGVEAALYLGRAAAAAKDWDAAAKGFGLAAERGGTEDLADIRAQSYFGLGQVAAAREKWEDAARYFMSVAVLYDDPELAPESLFRAAECFGHANRPSDGQKALAELKERYPSSPWAARSSE